MAEQAYIAVCADHLAMAVLVKGKGTYELMVPQETFLGCIACDLSAKFAFRKRPTTPFDTNVMTLNDGD